MKYEINKIYNEDSFEAIKNIPSNSIDCIYVDVPYLLGVGGSVKSKFSQSMTKSREELKNANIHNGFDLSILKEFDRVMKKVNIFIWCSESQFLDILLHYNRKNIHFKELTWNKINPVPACNKIWLPDIEYCLYFRESGVKLNDGYHLKSKFYTSGTNQIDKKLYQHPTIKPLELVKRHLLHTTQEGDTVADFFLGSGTTAVACQEIGRNFIGFEINKDFFDIAVNRLNGIDKNNQTSIFTDFENL